MTLEYLIHQTGHLTPVEAEIGAYILEHLDRIPALSIAELAAGASTSKSAVHRFCKKIGFDGFNDLKVAAARDLAEARSTARIDVNYPFGETDGPQPIAQKLAKLYESAIQDTFRQMDFIQVQRVARVLNKASGIDIYTHAHNMNVAENFQDKMLTIGKHVNCPHGFYNQRATVLASTPDRAALLLSYSGRASFMQPILQVLARKKVPAILIGKAGSNLYPQYVTYALSISSQENLRDRISQFSSHIAMQYMMDVLFGCIYNLDREKNIRYLQSSIDFMDDRDLES